MTFTAFCNTCGRGLTKPVEDKIIAENAMQQHFKERGHFNVKIYQDDPKIAKIVKRLQKLANGDYESCPQCGKDFRKSILSRSPLDEHMDLKHRKNKIAITRKNPTIDRIGRVEKVLNYQFPINSEGKEEERNMSPEEISGLSEYMNKGTKIRPSKPKVEDYNRMISASLEELKEDLMEAKIAIQHNHRIEWRSTKIASLGEPKVPTRVGKYVKYWLLNAKDVNGNHWGVNASTIDHNIQYFKNRPFVITDKSWVPNSAYDTYDHPYLPTNNLYAVLKHQEMYRVGTIREVNKEGDDYYAIIEMLPKYANKALPAFCSPAVFQVDFREPEDNISKWIPLHLAGLDTSPAYGARIALLKGSCIGTSSQCSVQLKTAKLLQAMTKFKCDFCDQEFDTMGELEQHKYNMMDKYHPGTLVGKIICPQKIAAKIVALKLAELDDDDNTTYQKSKNLKIISQKNAKYDIMEQPKVKINPEHGKQIADAYGAMKHEPNNPEVKKSYDALIDETGKQFSDLLKGGLKIDKIKPGENPYPDSKSMHKDISENNHLSYFPTEHGFGAGEENKDHPMMRETEFKHEGKPMLANDVFRIVHDINGHHRGGMSGFGPKGEQQAYLTHRKMYSETARGALASETMGQNNYVNFGPNGEHNRRDPKNTIYAPQKAGLMPKNIINGEFHNES